MLLFSDERLFFSFQINIEQVWLIYKTLNDVV